VQVVGVELDPVHRRRAGVAQAALGFVEVVGAAGGEHHRGPAGEPARHRQPDLAAPAEHQDRSLHAAQSAACHLRATSRAYADEVRLPLLPRCGLPERDRARRRGRRRRIGHGDGVPVLTVCADTA
jgi:hypothetical protein